MKLVTCPHCGEIIDLDRADPGPLRTGEPGIIRDEDAAEAEIFNRITMNDLTGDPFHDWPLIVARFQHSLPDLVEVIYSDPKLTRYLRGQPRDTAAQPAAQAGPSQLWLDLDAIRPHLSLIVQDGQFVYGYQSRIAEALGVPNQGNYRRRIQNVVSALQRTLIRNSNTSNVAATPRPAILSKKPRSEAA